MSGAENRWLITSQYYPSLAATKHMMEVNAVYVRHWGDRAVGDATPTHTQTRRLAWTSCASVACAFSLKPTMDDIQLVASVAAGYLLAFWDSLGECVALPLLD
ncbi:hypothetical protein B0H14DRAFT_2602455 [Mycena olivaceomarginata]|nr:hypothetical protein B0H14DRAFT_2602455 [Mycena olivaceomarginata]